MFRSIKNIFILILIGIIASGMPIYANNINLSSITSTIITAKDTTIIDSEEKANEEPQSNKAEFALDFNESSTYVHALSDSDIEEDMPLTLYFPDEKANFLIPVTRFIPSTTTPLTKTLRNLESGPSYELGLYNNSPIPKEGTSGRTHNIAYVNLPVNLSPYDESSASSIMAVNSIVNSLTSVDGISEVRFQFDGLTKEEAFHGMIMNEPYYREKDPVIYTAHLSNTDRLLLTPVSINKFNIKYNEENYIPSIFELMKFKETHNVYNSDLYPIVPNEVKLLDYTINNNTLTLTFNEEFENAYAYDNNLKQMMIDGIIFTFKSLEGIDFINIQLRTSSENGDKHTVTTYDFEQPVYINPEI